MKVNNYSKIVVEKVVSIAKYLFHLSNILLIIFYLYPGSIFGCFIYSDCKIQPQLTSDFLVSSNHVYVFIIISLLGFTAYSKKNSIYKNNYIYFFYFNFFRISTHNCSK